MRRLWMLPLGLGCLCLGFAAADFYFFFALTHRWFSLASGVAAAVIGPGAIASGLHSRHVFGGIKDG